MPNAKVIENFEVLVRSVLPFVMDRINNLRLKELRGLLRYHFWSKSLKGSPKKVELVEAVDEFLEMIGIFLQRGGGGRGVKNEGVPGYGEDMGKSKRLETTYKNCVRLLWNFFNVTYSILLIWAHKCRPPGGVKSTIASAL